MHLRKYFKVKIREPYMGNDVPLKIEVRVYEHGPVIVKVWNPEGMVYEATEVEPEMFNG